MTSVLKVSKITGQDGGTNPPLSFDGDTATLDSSVSVKTGTVLKQNPPLFFSAYITGNNEIPHANWTELSGSAHNSAGVDVSWAIQPTAGASGAANANPFSKFDTTTGRFTPGRAGFYFFTYFCYFSEDLSDGKLVFALCSRNGYNSPTNSSSGTDANKENTVCFIRQQNGTGDNTGITGSGCINMDTDDYVSLHLYQNQGDARRLNSGRFSGFYIGENF